MVMIIIIIKEAYLRDTFFLFVSVQKRFPKEWLAAPFCYLIGEQEKGIWVLVPSHP